jgi:hypothetical protein
MANLPEKDQQIIQSHAQLIVNVVKACQNRELLSQLDPVLESARQNGWEDLVKAIRSILGGNRESGVLADLDEEDTIIVEAILRGLQDPASLPDPAAASDPTMAAPGLAYMIHAAETGDPNALQMIASIAEQMTHTVGDMSRLGKAISRMVHGERDTDKLCEGMDTRGEKLVSDILHELNKLRTH